VPVLFCSLELYLPYCQSLKDKRQVIRSAAEKLRNQFRCSVSELDHQDLWQRSRLGLAAVGPNRSVLEQVADQMRRESERLLGADLLQFTVQFLEHE
jgi:hypothetical protein